MIIDCISDLHGFYPKLDGGDLLIVAGDLTARDLESEVALFDYWLNEQKYNCKIVIAGNHDNVLAENRIELQFGQYLCDSGTEFEGLKIWGSPWSLWFHGVNPKCKAFMGSEKDLKKKFDLIPDDVDILVTHSPPYGILDKNYKNEHCGSVSLRNRILDANKFKNLNCHIFGHIHEFGGKVFETSLARFINASHVNEHYQPVNKPIRIQL